MSIRINLLFRVVLGYFLLFYIYIVYSEKKELDEVLLRDWEC